MNKLDLVGQKFHMLTVVSSAISRKKPNGQTVSMWNCLCDCGKKTTVSLSELKGGGTKSCGCLRTAAKNNLLGKKFGLWTVVERTPAKRCSYLCRCECGTEKVIRADHLKTFSETSSCGCNRSETQKKQYQNGRKTREINLKNKVFGKLHVLDGPIHKNNTSSTYWVCECKCGNIVEKSGEKLRRGMATSCGCLTKELRSKNRIIDLSEKTFGEWTVLKRGKDHICPKGQSAPKWLCQCSCGTKREVFGAILRNGTSMSCGCLKASKGERAIAEILQKERVEFLKEYQFEDLVSSKGNPLRFDFCLLKSGKIVALIEYQGEQHFYKEDERFGYNQRKFTDPKKKKYCEVNNISLYEVRFDEDIAERICEILIDLKLLQDNSVPSLT